MQKLLTCLLFIMLTACAEGPKQTLQLAHQGLLSGALSRDGNLAVIGSVHHGGSLWDVDRKERLYDWNHKSGEFSSIRATAISGDSKAAVTCVGDNMVLWNVETGEYKQYWRAPDKILSIRLDETGDRALMGLENGTAAYFDMRNGSTIHIFNHDAEVGMVDIDAQGQFGITGSEDKSAKIWNLRSGELVHSMTLNNFINTVAISPSGELAFVTSLREDALVWDTQSGKVKFRFPNRYTNYHAAAFSEDERFLSVGTFQGEVKRFQISNGAEAGKWQAKPRQSYGAASSKAIIAIVDQGEGVTVLTSDGLMQRF
ncbi:MAG: hypothetical protein R3183_00380 [Oleiphilaceae bacterium]|nr:hypothetical protein [Oleiphilaceae bacterium]